MNADLKNPEYYKKRFGIDLKNYRKEAGLTREAAAEKLGVTVEAIRKWETNECYPRFEMFLDIVMLYGVAPSKLMKPFDKAQWYKGGSGYNTEDSEPITITEVLSQLRYLEAQMQIAIDMSDDSKWNKQIQMDAVDDDRWYDEYYSWVQKAKAKIYVGLENVREGLDEFLNKNESKERED